MLRSIHSIARVSGCLLSRLARKLMHIWCVDVKSLSPSPLAQICKMKALSLRNAFPYPFPYPSCTPFRLHSSLSVKVYWCFDSDQSSGLFSPCSWSGSMAHRWLGCSVASLWCLLWARKGDYLPMLNLAREIVSKIMLSCGGKRPFKALIAVSPRNLIKILSQSKKETEVGSWPCGWSILWTKTKKLKS